MNREGAKPDRSRAEAEDHAQARRGSDAGRRRRREAGVSVGFDPWSRWRPAISGGSRVNSKRRSPSKEKWSF
ncbi:hypothetical protein KFK09_010569 [Dendrobium nobile]|uniref:Uncharacterized protein n=1 Tax=Dendrobium nobile TaxID=94219 RepID=A0A8T3BAC3_DENNO|nr:hypothetical protein KFK09_010569 [Dendrobium nobile]